LLLVNPNGLRQDECCTHKCVGASSIPPIKIFGWECDYASTFIADRAYDHESHRNENVVVYVRAFALPNNTRGGLECDTGGDEASG
jgi:hypothetical protein